MLVVPKPYDLDQLLAAIRIASASEAVKGDDRKGGSNITIELNYILKRNIGMVGRPRLACAVCNFSPSGHVLSASPRREPRREPRLEPRLEVVPEPDKGLCNVHARGLAQNQSVSNGKLDKMRQEWVASR